MQTIHGSQLNKISDKLRSECIKPLGVDDVAEFQLINGQMIVEKFHNKERLVEVFGQSRGIRLNDRIYDPYLTDNSGKVIGGTVHIGLPESIVDNKVERFRVYSVDAESTGKPGYGAIKLFGNNVDDQEVYEILCLLNENESFKYRSKSSVASFRAVNRVSESQATSKRISDKTEALVLVGGMKPAEIIEFCASKNWDTKGEPEILKARVEQYADENPTDFLRDTKDDSIKIKAKIKIAFDKNIIGYNPSSRTVSWGDGGVISILDDGLGDNQVDALAKWISISENGAKVFDSISKRLLPDKKKSEAS